MMKFPGPAGLLCRWRAGLLSGGGGGQQTSRAGEGAEVGKNIFLMDDPPPLIFLLRGVGGQAHFFGAMDSVPGRSLRRDLVLGGGGHANIFVRGRGGSAKYFREG